MIGTCSFCREVKKGSNYKGLFYCNKHWQRMYYHGTPYKLVRKSKCTFAIDGNVCRVVTSKGDEFIIDKEDVDKVNKHSWILYNGYPVSKINKKNIKISRFIMNVKDPDVIVDHINGNPLDNRKCNLRTCNKMQNIWNGKLHKNNTSGYPGVQWEKRRQKWIVVMMVNGKAKRFGSFADKKDAIKARMEAEEKYRGEFACHKSRDYFSQYMNPPEV